MFTESCRHLDANVLSAYLEGGLNKQARRRVQAHLGDCAECRRWTLCAQSCTTPGPMVQARSRRLIWMAPLATAASVTLVVSAVWLVRPITVQAPTERAGVAASVAATPAATKSKLPPAPRVLPSRHLRAPAPTTLAGGETERLSLPPATSPVGGELPAAIDFTPLMTGFQDQAPMGVPRAQLASFTDPHGTIATDAALPLAPDAATPSATAFPASPGVSGFAGSNFTGANTLSRVNHDANVGGPMAPAVSAGLGWAISRGGQVVRSIGSGMWAAVPLVPGVRIHALSASDSNIWAAGLSNQVYVSQDHGSHWRVVHLPSIGNQTAPIQSIVFSDAHHGMITAANGRVWQTSDGGNQWTIVKH